MGQRANLFEEARRTVEVIKSKAASKHNYEKNFPMSKNGTLHDSKPRKPPEWKITRPKKFYKDIILFKGGMKAMDIYKALHPNGKFRDK